MLETLAREWQLPYLDLDKIADHEILYDLLPAEFIDQHQLLVLTDRRIIIHDPSAQKVIQQVFFYLGSAGKLFLSEKAKLTQRISTLLHQKEKENLLNDQEASIVQYVEKLLREAASQKASDIHLETTPQQLIIRFRLDGLLYEIARIAGHFASRIVTHLKVLAQLDMTEKRLPQDGRLRISAFSSTTNSSEKVDYRISTCPTLHAEKVVLRILNTHHHPLEIAHLGFSAAQKKLFLSALDKPQGMILVTGPTGSGKTITLYTALNILNKSAYNILSVEDPVEITLSGINQVPVNSKIGLTFTTILRAFLRQDPDIIMIGEMRDKETADIAIKAAQTGHLVLSTLHTNSAAKTLSRLLNMGLPAYDIAASVSLIIAQRLVRILCQYCKIKDNLSPYYQAAGCVKCHHGYYGRTGIYEFLPITPVIAKHILKQSSAEILEDIARQQENMQILYHSGLEKVNAGLTTLSELSRVLRI